ncbi:hypothetical protein HDU83_005116 [Entophlyctis luteolus]|nr:hypothetical protein HDU83_005116 [Entophlyctis luteolus]KAJ3381270.1 hypothetical protein HDU84_005235 [Entophlyctis sp. JEL0112]
MKFIATILAAALANAASLVDVLTSAGENTLLSLVQSDEAILTAVGSFNGTFFAPTDAALAATVAAGFNASDITALSAVLSYHAVSGTVFSGANFTGTTFLTTLEGSEVKVEAVSSGIQIGSAFGATVANVVKSLPFDGGYVHVVDATLTPPANIATVATAANLTSLLSALKTANLTSTVAGLKIATVFAPTNDAFAAISSVIPTLTSAQLAQVLLLHVIPGKLVHSTDVVKAVNLTGVATASNYTLSVNFNGTNVLVSGTGNKAPATVIAADVLADQVIVHVIDTVLLPNFNSSSTAKSTTSAATFTAALTALSIITSLLVL